MTNEEYVKNAIRTESSPKSAQERIDNFTLNEVLSLYGAIREAITSLSKLDKWKKHIFYGKPLTKDVIGLREDEHRRAYNGGMNISEKVDEILHSVIGIATEAGELLEAVKRIFDDGELDENKKIDHKEELDYVNLSEENGDLFWYSAILSDTIGKSFDEMMETNIAKLRKRYPDKYSDEKGNQQRFRSREKDTRTMKTIRREYNYQTFILFLKRRL